MFTEGTVVYWSKIKSLKPYNDDTKYIVEFNAETFFFGEDDSKEFREYLAKKYSYGHTPDKEDKQLILEHMNNNDEYDMRHLPYVAVDITSIAMKYTDVSVTYRLTKYLTIDEIIDLIEEDFAEVPIRDEIIILSVEK